MAILIRRQLNYAAVATGFFLGRVIFIIENMHAALSAKTPPRIHAQWNTLISIANGDHTLPRYSRQNVPLNKPLSVINI